MAVATTVSPCPRLSHESVLSGNKLLVWGGELIDSKVKKMLSRQEIFSFDLTSQQWSQTTAKITTRRDKPTPCALAQTIVIDNTAYSFGGYYNKGNKFVCIDELLSLDCEEMTCKKLSITGNKPKPTARDSYGLCAVGEKFLMHGGAITDPSELPLGVLYKQCSPKYGCIDDCWEFSPLEVSWTRLQIRGRSPSPRCGHSLTATPTGKFVLYGGFDGNWLSDMHLLNCEDGIWTCSEVVRTSMWLAGRAWHRTCCVSPSLCLVMGGFVEDCPDENAYVVDITRGTAQVITLCDARGMHTACCRVASDGSAQIFVFGGTRDNLSDVTSCLADLRVYAWDPKAPTTLSICHNGTAQQ